MYTKAEPKKNAPIVLLYDQLSLFLVLIYKKMFVAVFLGYNQYWPGGFMFFVVLCPGAPEGSTSSGSGFKAS